MYLVIYLLPMSRLKDQCTEGDKALALMGQGGANLELFQSTLPEHLRLKDGEDHDSYLHRVSGSFIEWLVYRAMVKEDGSAVGAVTRLIEKKMEAQIKLAQVMKTPRGTTRRIIEGAPGDIRRAMGSSSLDSVMAGQARPSDLTGAR